jgi:predicted DNA-binding transcriptional regulator YafY
LESMLPGRMRDQLREVADIIQIQPSPGNPLEGKTPVYECLREAVAIRKSVRIRYGSVSENREIRTKLQPYRLFFSRRSWYVIGRSSLHRETRTFNLGRINDIEKLDERYQIPRGFSLERFFRNAWHLIPEPGPDSDVIVRFGVKVAQNVSEVVWHKTQRLAWEADGSLLFQVRVSGVNEISWWIMGYGDQAEVLEPAPLRRLVADRAERTAALYRKESSG